MKKEITVEEGNEAISRFVNDCQQGFYSDEGTFLPSKYCNDTSSEAVFYKWADMRYHTSWDWLMPVVEKIAVEGPLFRMVIGNVNCVAHFEDVPIKKSHEPKAIDTVWQQVVQFITWYNNQTPTA